MCGPPGSSAYTTGLGRRRGAARRARVPARRDEHVLVAVRDEDRRSLGLDVVERRRRERLTRPVDRAVVAEQADGARDRGVGVLEAWLEGAVVRRERRGRRGGRPRSSGDQHHRGVGAVLGCVAARPGDRLLRVDEVVGEDGPRSQPVAGADADPAVPGELDEERPRVEALAAHEEAAAVQVDQEAAPPEGRAGWQYTSSLLRRPASPVRQVPGCARRHGGGTAAGRREDSHPREATAEL